MSPLVSPALGECPPRSRTWSCPIVLPKGKKEDDNKTNVWLRLMCGMKEPRCQAVQTLDGTCLSMCLPLEPTWAPQQVLDMVSKLALPRMRKCH